VDENRFKFVEENLEITEQIAAPTYSYWQSVSTQFFNKKGIPILLFMVIIISLMAFIQPQMSGYDPQLVPNINDPAKRFLGISWQYPFGTDDVGNSVWDVVWAGTRTSLIVGFTVTLINTSIGVTVGAIWGFSRRVDAIMMEFFNISSSVPDILIVTVLMYAFGAGFWQLILAMCLTGWLSTAYLIRTQVLLIRDREYNVVSRCLGTPTLRLIIRNIFPFLISVIVTVVANQIPIAISTEVMLSYLGIGLGVETASLGRMIAKYSNYFTGYPHLFWAPVLMLAAVTIALYVMGQTLADASDPKKHR